MAKLIGQAGEAAKVKIRQVRKESVSEVRKLASEDDQKRAEKQVRCHSQHNTAVVLHLSNGFLQTP